MLTADQSYPWGKVWASASAGWTSHTGMTRATAELIQRGRDQRNKLRLRQPLPITTVRSVGSCRRQRRGHVQLRQRRSEPDPAPAAGRHRQS